MPLKAILLAAGAVACGIAAFVLYSMEGSRLAVRDHDVSVEGTILRSWSTRRKGNTRHWLDYTYSVDGAAYKVEERPVNGPLGGRVRVWYDPASPDRCVSDPELRYGRDIKFTLLFAFVGAILLFYAGKATRRRPG
ncbi:MAG TPA: DUF3592 domain-containing protein [Planctomycetota bacterium]